MNKAWRTLELLPPPTQALKPLLTPVMYNMTRLAKPDVRLPFSTKQEDNWLLNKLSKRHTVSKGTLA